MSCHRQHVAAAICTLIEDISGEKVNQADWHGLVARAREKGYPMGRKRLDIHGTIYALRALGESEGNSEVAETALANIGYTDEGRSGMSIDAVDGKFPTYTQNMAAVVRYLTNEGVVKSLTEVRADRKAQLGTGISDADITARIGGRRGNFGKEFKSYDFTVMDSTAPQSDTVIARSLEEAKSTVNEWAVRFQGMDKFTTIVTPSEPVITVSEPKHGKEDQRRNLNGRYVQCDECGSVVRVTAGVNRMVTDHADCAGSGRKVRYNSDFTAYEQYTEE